ncbi:MAG: DUF1289 domain-containing protein [Pseudomonadota bacterium]
MESPCVQICVIDDVSGFCIGCGRTRQEIAGWRSMTDDQRRDSMEGLADRMMSITRDRKRRGGRSRNTA